MRVTIDDEAGMAYVYLTEMEDTLVARSIEVRDGKRTLFMLDLDDEDRLVGIEVFNPDLLPQDLIDGAESY